MLHFQVICLPFINLFFVVLMAYINVFICGKMALMTNNGFSFEIALHLTVHPSQGMFVHGAGLVVKQS